MNKEDDKDYFEEAKREVKKQLSSEEIKKEIKAVENLGYNCEFVTKTGLPFEVEGAICFKKQAQFPSVFPCVSSFGAAAKKMLKVYRK